MYKLKDFTNGGILMIRPRHVSSISYEESEWHGNDVINVAIVFVSGNRELITLQNTPDNKGTLEGILMNGR